MPEVSYKAWGWNGQWNKIQHRKLIQEGKILPTLLPGIKPTTFWPRIWHSSTELSIATPSNYWSISKQFSFCHSINWCLTSGSVLGSTVSLHLIVTPIILRQHLRVSVLPYLWYMRPACRLLAHTTTISISTDDIIVAAEFVCSVCAQHE